MEVLESPPSLVEREKVMKLLEQQQQQKKKRPPPTSEFVQKFIHDMVKGGNYVSVTVYYCGQYIHHYYLSRLSKHFRVIAILRSFMFSSPPLVYTFLFSIVVLFSQFIYHLESL